MTLTQSDGALRAAKEMLEASEAVERLLSRASASDETHAAPPLGLGEFSTERLLSFLAHRP